MFRAPTTLRHRAAQSASSQGADCVPGSVCHWLEMAYELSMATTSVHGKDSTGLTTSSAPESAEVCSGTTAPLGRRLMMHQKKKGSSKTLILSSATLELYLAFDLVHMKDRVVQPDYASTNSHSIVRFSCYLASTCSLQSSTQSVSPSLVGSQIQPQSGTNVAETCRRPTCLGRAGGYALNERGCANACHRSFEPGNSQA